jgi:hypothetical protein
MLIFGALSSIQLLMTVPITVLDYNYVCLQPSPQRLPLPNTLAYLTKVQFAALKSFITMGFTGEAYSL